MLRALFCLATFSIFLITNSYGENTFQDASSIYAKSGSYQPFTGRIARDRVRLRLHPTTDSPIIKELNRGDMLLITGEEDDFYAVKPMTGSQAYIYRTYVLDGIVEGTKLNVRLEPHLEAPVIGQLNRGDRVKGKISEKNSKWLEINPPEATRFYVSADFVEKIGDADYLARFEKRKEEVNDLLNGTYLISQQELQKPFSQIEPNRVVGNYKKIIEEYTEFPKEKKQAEDSLAAFQDTYLHKKIDYLEEKTRQPSSPWTVSEEAREPSQQRLQASSPQAQESGAQEIYKQWVHEQEASSVNARMALWIPVEIAYYEEWAKKNEGRPIQDFYVEQRGSAIALRGIIEPYDRPVRNKPGDYLLVNRGNRLPIAYLYSTQVNLQDMIGQEATLEAALRPNNNFAYPAYYILNIE